MVHLRYHLLDSDFFPRTAKLFFCEELRRSCLVGSGNDEMNSTVVVQKKDIHGVDNFLKAIEDGLHTGFRKSRRRETVQVW